MDRILVGVDGSEVAQDALGWAAQVAGRGGFDLVAVRVFEPSQAELPPEHDAALHDEQRKELEEWCRVRPEGTPEPRALLVDGDPPGALLATATSEAADLLVVGGRGRGGFAHMHLGSVAHHLTHHTTLPLAIVPPSGAAAVEHIVLGVDGSPGSLAAVDLCADLAAGLGVGVTAIYAFEPFAEWVPPTDPRSWHRRARTEAESWTEPIARAGVPLDVRVERDAHPVAAIARAVEAHPGSVAAVGTRGLGGFVGLRLGRVPLQLVHHAGTAVIHVPPGLEG